MRNIKTNKFCYDKRKVDNLIECSKILNEIKSSFRYWKIDQIWPTNLHIKGIETCIDLLNSVIISEDFIDKY